LRRFFLLILLSLFLCYCGDLDRDNPLDPKNPKSNVERAILAELFVNDSTSYDYCNFALDAIEKLSQQNEFKGKLFVLEYHLTNRTSDWDDVYALDQCNQRYYNYVSNSNERAIPDAFFNGKAARVQGASRENIDHRYLTAAQNFLGLKSYFGIEGTKKKFNNSIQLTISIARYGNSWEDDIEVNVVLYEDLESARHRYVVRKIFQPQTITTIKPGGIKSLTFTEPLSQFQHIENLYLMVILQDKNGPTKEVYQVAKF